MKTKLLLTLIAFVAIGCDGNPREQVPPSANNPKAEVPPPANNPRDDYVVPKSLTFDPSFFRKDQSVSVKASLPAPPPCSGGYGITLRAYDTEKHPDPSALVFSGTNRTQFVFETGAPVEGLPAVGAPAEVTFVPFVAPQNSPAKLTLVVWSWCSTRIPKGIDENFEIIWEEKTLGAQIMSANFGFQCPGDTATVCAYRPE
jgi:hypothetical protein